MEPVEEENVSAITAPRKILTHHKISSNFLETAGLVVSALSVYLGLWTFAIRENEAGLQVLITILLFCLNFGFLGFILFSWGRAVKPLIKLQRKHATPVDEKGNDVEVEEVREANVMNPVHASLTLQHGKDGLELQSLAQASDLKRSKRLHEDTL